MDNKVVVVLESRIKHCETMREQARVANSPKTVKEYWRGKRDGLLQAITVVNNLASDEKETENENGK